MMMEDGMQFELDSFEASRLLNITTINLPASGVLFTFTFNSIICAVLFLLFIFILQPCLPLFNVTKKKRLMKKVKQEMTVDMERKHLHRRGATLSDFVKSNMNIDRIGGNSRLDEAAVYADDVSLLDDAPESDIESLIDDDFDEDLGQGEKLDEKMFKNMLDLNATEDEMELTNYTSAGTFMKTNVFTRLLRKWGAVLRELAIYVWRVFLSFFNHKHNMDDMKHLASKYSRDVAVYLLFQKEIILALGLCAFLAASILLPLHLTGKEPVYQYQFEYGSYNLTQEDYPLLKTSVSMVITSPTKLYAHVILGVFFVIIFYVFLHRFKTSEVVQQEHFLEEQLLLQAQSDSFRRKKIRRSNLVSNYSVKLYNLPIDFPSPKAFDKMVREELCPDLKVFKTVLMLNFVDRIELQKKYKYYCDMVERYIYLEEYKGKSPVVCFCSRRNGYRTLDAIDYYQNKMKECEEKMREWEKKYTQVITDGYDETTEDIYPAGYGFVVFETPEDAQECLQRYYKRGTIIKPVRAFTADGKQGEVLRTVSFQVTSAYEPNDINWDNMLTYSGLFDNLRNLFIQLILVVIFIFFTSPLAAVSGAQSLAAIPAFSKFNLKIQSIFKKSGKLGTAIFQYLPTLLLHIFSTGMPYVIWYMSDFAKYRSKSRYNRKLMSRMYIYLLLSTLLMPSMLLTSLDAVVTYLKDSENIRLMFSKMFLPASGAFFINYVLQSVLLKNFGDIIRVFNILNFIWGTKHYPNTTPKEVLKACELSEFYFEYEYSYMISVLAMVLCYSVFSPVILFFGLAYMLLKHLIDRYVIMYIYGHKKQAARGVLSFDFKAHRKHTNLISQMMLTNMIISLMAMTIFFGTRVHTSSALLPHAIIAGSCFGVVFVLWILEYVNNISILSFLKTKFIRVIGANKQSAEARNTLLSQDYQSDYGSEKEEFKRHIKEENLDIYTDSRFIRAYEPPFQYVKNFKTWSEISVERSIGLKKRDQATDQNQRQKL